MVPCGHAVTQVHGALFSVVGLKITCYVFFMVAFCSCMFCCANSFLFIGDVSFRLT